jgi:hypothetical protein
LKQDADYTSGTSGALQPDIPTPIDDIIDGPKNTLLVIEVSGRPTLYKAGTKTSGTTSIPGGWGDPQTGLFKLHGADKAGNVDAGTCIINCTNEYGMYSPHKG